MVTYLEFLDLFDKNTHDELKMTTKYGSVVSILLTVVSSILIITNVALYINPRIYRDLSVKPSVTSASETINISLTIKIAMPCYFLHIDYMDSLGFQRSYIKNTVTFRRLNNLGRVIGYTNDTLSDVCEPCYNLSTNPDECCNSCLKVQLLSLMQNKPVDFSKYRVCNNYEKKPNVSLSEKCLVKGKLTVNRIPGSFHIAPGTNVPQSAYLHDLSSMQMFHDMTHSIQRLRFGPHIPRTSNPLDNFKSFQQIPTHDRTYFYNLLITPVIFYRDGVEYLKGYEYTAFSEALDTFQLFGISPGLFFQYQFTPYTIVVSANRQNFLQFISNTFGVISGIYACLSILDKLIGEDIGSNVVEIG